MNPLFLLKLIFDLIKDDKPTAEEVRCARTIANNLIDYYTTNTALYGIENTKELMDSELSPEALQAQRELQ